MKISRSTIAMVSNHFTENSHTETEDLKIWMDQPASATDTVKLSEQVNSLSAEKDSKLSALDADEAIKGDPKLLIIKKLIEALTGKEIRLCEGPQTEQYPQGVAIDAGSSANDTGQSNRVGVGNAV